MIGIEGEKYCRFMPRPITWMTDFINLRKFLNFL